MNHVYIKQGKRIEMLLAKPKLCAMVMTLRKIKEPSETEIITILIRLTHLGYVGSLDQYFGKISDHRIQGPCHHRLLDSIVIF